MKKYLFAMLAVVFLALGLSSLVESPANVEQHIRGEAQRLIDKASAIEPEITAFLMTMESEEVTLIGLDYRLKSIESLAGKIRRYMVNQEMSLQDAVNEMHDVLRYTFCIKDDQYTEKTLEVLQSLRERGYNLRWFANYWKERTYKGINTLVHFRRGDDFIFEIQFHTPESFDTKENKTHSYYEIMRSVTSTEEEIQEAREKSIELFDAVPIPEGAEDIRWEAEFMKDAA